MLGRQDYTRQEFDQARSGVRERVDAYRQLASATTAHGNADAVAALAAFEPEFCATMLIALDRPFVHRERMVTGRDCNPLNEVEVLVDSLLHQQGVLRSGSVIKWIPDQTVLKLRLGSRIRLDLGGFQRLADAFFTELERLFL